MTGRDLRDVVDSFQDVLIDVDDFLRKKNVLTKEAKDTIEAISEGCETLFYLIPLES